MVRRIVPSGVVSFVLLAAFGAVCQNLRPALPDTPSVQAASQASRFNVFLEEAHSPLTSGGVGGDAGLVRQGGGFAAADSAALNQRGSGTIFEKYLSPSSQRQP